MLGNRLVDTIERLIKAGAKADRSSPAPKPPQRTPVRSKPAPWIYGAAAAIGVVVLLAGWFLLQVGLPGKNSAGIGPTPGNTASKDPGPAPAPDASQLPSPPRSRAPLAPIVDTRRAFIVGNQNYRDGNIQQLSRTATDAEDIAADLADTGFDKTKITLANNIQSKDAFDKAFTAFVATVRPGDTVFFFFAGYGFGIAPEQNYLLMGDLRSPFEFTRSQLPQAERGNADVVRLRISRFLDAYQKTEIPKSGVLLADIENRLAEKKPEHVFMALDASRSLLPPDTKDNDGPSANKDGSPSNGLIPPDQAPPPGFVVLLSASSGEEAVEIFDANDRRRNSLFTEVLRAELQRPGQTLRELAKRIGLTVHAVAQAKGRQQNPDFEESVADEYGFVEPIGAERFVINSDRCADEHDIWQRIRANPDHNAIERFRLRFDGCATSKSAGDALAELELEPEDSTLSSPGTSNRPISECDRFAASYNDPARPAEVPATRFTTIEADVAISACQKAAADNPRVPRYLFNLGSAYLRRGTDPAVDQPERVQALSKARLAFNDAAAANYNAALNSLAVLYEFGLGVDPNVQEAIKFLNRAAQQGIPLAMYNLGQHYKRGNGVKPDLAQAYQWFVRAAETGYVPAMLAVAEALRSSYGRVNNPPRAVDYLISAAEAGSTRAKRELGQIYLNGVVSSGTVAGDRSRDIQPDVSLALLWFARAAEADDAVSQAYLARMMQDGTGLAQPQPEVAERYWRLAAYADNGFAAAQLGDRLRRDFNPSQPRDLADSPLYLLQRAMSAGSPRATLTLAQVYRKGELGWAKNATNAIKLAFRSIELAIAADVTGPDGDPRNEFAAGQFMADMLEHGEAVDASGRPLFTAAEVDRLRRYYGHDQTSIRTLNVLLSCGGWERREPILVWDWDRPESPVESQFRYLERITGCDDKDGIRKSLADVYEEAKATNVSFIDLANQWIKIAPSRSGESDYTTEIKSIVAKSASFSQSNGNGRSDVTETAVYRAFEGAYRNASLEIFETFLGENWTFQRLSFWVLRHASAGLNWMGNNRNDALMSVVDERIQRAATSIYRVVFEMSEFIAASRSSTVFMQRLSPNLLSDAFGIESLLDQAVRRITMKVVAKFDPLFQRNENAAALRYRAQRIVMDCLSENVDRIASSETGIATVAEIEDRIVVMAGNTCSAWLEHQFGTDGVRLATQKPLPLRTVWTVSGPMDDPSMYARPVRGR